MNYILNPARSYLILILIMIAFTQINAQSTDTTIISGRFKSFVWPSQVPDGCPIPKSENFTKVVFTGKYRSFTNADTYYPTWASDGKLYSPWTDGRIGEIESMSGYHLYEEPVTGYAVIEGSNPMNLKISRLGLIRHDPFPYVGQYPCGSLVHNGIWYYGTYSLDWKKGPVDTMGPFVGFNISKDFGKTWLPETRTAFNPLFGETAKSGEPVKMFKKQEQYDASEFYLKGTLGARVKIGAPHFVDFGKNMEHSPDGKAYLVAHGAVNPTADNSWCSGDQIYLVRVLPTPENINDMSKYEYFAGHDQDGKAQWSNNFSDIKPMMEWNDNAGIVTMTWNNPLNKYIMCVSYWGDPGGVGTSYDTYILESDNITGPWKMITYMKKFGPQAYFVNIPSKFISKNGKKMWLCYSANWIRRKKGNPPGSKYGFCLQEIKLKP